MKITKLFSALLILALISSGINSIACTGIRLIAKDGGVIYGRTMEWGSFDLHSRVAIVPRGYEFTSLTPEGQNGLKYKTKYGFIGLDMLNKDFIADGLNEKGLAIGMFYHPGYAEYPEFDTSEASKTISAQEVANYILANFANVEEVKEGMPKVKVVGVVEKAIGIQVDAHWMVTDAQGKSIAIEYTNDAIKIHEAPLGVITNAPNYDWHMTNLSNYLNLSMFSVKPKNLSDLEIRPTGAGSGMIGLPGDNTPPSRFIRAVSWTQTARKLETAEESIYESFRILDNFQLPLGPDGAEGAGEFEHNDLMRSSTIWTVSWNLKDMTLNYHTQHNRRVRQLDIKTIDFEKIGKEIVHLDMQKKKEQDILDITPSFSK